MKTSTEHKTSSSLPAINLSYDRENSWQRGNVFAMAFVYPHPSFCHDGHRAFKVTGGILDIREFISQQVLPAVVHITQFPKMPGKQGRVWGIELFGVNVRFSQTGKLHQIIRDVSPSEQRVVVEYDVFVPRGWIPELEQFLLPEHKRILDRLQKLDAKIKSEERELNELIVKLSTTSILAGSLHKNSIKKKVAKTETNLKKHNAERSRCAPVCKIMNAHAA